MNQSELVEKVAQATELNTRLAGVAVKAVVAAILDSVKEIGSAEVKRLRQSQPIEKARKLNGMYSDPPLGPPVPNWLPRQLPPLAAMNGRTCRVEPIDNTRHGKALYAAYAADREGRLWTYLPWGPYSGPEELCAQIDAVRASGIRPEFALINLASGKPFGQASYL